MDTAVRKAPVVASTESVELDWAGRPVRVEYQWLRREDTQAPLMVFLHEGLGSVSMWRDFPAALCEALGCRGLVYSRPGYGLSTPRASGEQWRPDFMHRQAREVLPALLSALDIDPIQDRLWLLGHSDGGSIALLYAALFPDRLSGAIVLAPHILVEDVSIESIAEARTAYLDTDLRQRLARHHRDPDSAFWGWNDIWLHPDFRSWRIDQELHTITCPLLAVQGVNDRYGTMEQVHGIARVAPQCAVVELADCGHSPHLEQRDRLIEVVRNFYSSTH
ncbi:alpha/beta hydrolase [Rhodoferax sp. GW822-FHT02A01]|uniref:alpha/beta fold hydrolase n=1 Tax=Rhodoferax sp. GW822-FHT02A01 TaxID=3141537 RepID=UPI00315D8296